MTAPEDPAVPFRIANGYWNPKEAFDPTQEQLTAYVRWLEAELLTARRSLALLHSAEPPPFSDTLIGAVHAQMFGATGARAAAKAAKKRANKDNKATSTEPPTPKGA